MVTRKFHFEDFFTVEVRKIEQDLSYDYSVDGVAGTVMECLDDKLSPGLYDTLYDLLLGFNNSAQLELAEDLLDFTLGHVIHTTNCPSMDYVLYTCYTWIAEEQGILDDEAIQEMLNDFKF